MGLRDRARTLVVSVAILGAAVALLTAAGNLLWGIRPLNLNDTHIKWLTTGSRFFVPSPGHPGMLETDPELVSLDNPAVRFTAVKRPGTLRIFCVGGSTTRGWPYQNVCSYPAILARMARDADPHGTVEVINAGFMGSDSTSDLRLISELVAYQPDLFVVYEGWNESWNWPLHGFPVKMLAGIHYWLLGHAWWYERAFHRVSDTEFNHGRYIRLIISEGSDAGIPAVLERLARNIGGMIDLSRRNGAEVVLVTQVMLRKSDRRISAINNTIAQVCRARGTAFIDCNAAFTFSGRPVSELMLPDGMHPDYAGYALMARTVCGALSAMGDSRTGAWRTELLRSDAQYLRECGLTEDEEARIASDIVSMLAARQPGTDASVYRRRIERARRKA